MTIKQLNIFGEEIDYNEVIEEQKPKPRMTIKERFRSINGINKSHKCKECQHCIRYILRNGKSYYKCQKMGISSSEATDIRLKDYSCNLFKVVEEWN